MKSLMLMMLAVMISTAAFASDTVTRYYSAVTKVFVITDYYHEKFLGYGITLNDGSGIYCDINALGAQELRDKGKPYYITEKTECDLIMRAMAKNPKIVFAFELGKDESGKDIVIKVTNTHRNYDEMVIPGHTELQLK